MTCCGLSWQVHRSYPGKVHCALLGTEAGVRRSTHTELDISHEAIRCDVLTAALALATAQKTKSNR